MTCPDGSDGCDDPNSSDFNPDGSSAPPPVQEDPNASSSDPSQGDPSSSDQSAPAPIQAGDSSILGNDTGFVGGPGGNAGDQSFGLQTFTDPTTGATIDSSTGMIVNAPQPGGGVPGFGSSGGSRGGGGGGGGGGTTNNYYGGNGKAPALAGGGMWSEADFQAYMQYLNKQADVETQRYNQSYGLQQQGLGLEQQRITNQNQQFQASQAQQAQQFQKDLDLRTAVANATQAYQTSLIQTRNVELAQNAARDAMTRDFQMQDLQFRQQQNAANVDIEREKLDLQRRLLPASRTTRRAATVQNI